MSDALELWEQPEIEEMYMLAGWRQWADAGSISSRLPLYIVQQTEASQIGQIRPDGFYIFQIPGTHDLVRPVVKFDQGFPESLSTRNNEFFYTEVDKRGLVIFMGDEPHMDVERYAEAFLEAARRLGVKRIISFGGVYGELPYDKERMVSAIYSLQQLKDELEVLEVNLSDYHGGASIGSYLCRRAADAGMEYVGLYAFVPTYDFAKVAQLSSTIRIENDFAAWLGAMRRVTHMLKINFDLSDLEAKSQQLIETMDGKVDEIDEAAPQLDVRDYMRRLSEEFDEKIFNPLDEVWEQELRRIFDEFDEDEEG